MYTEREEKKKIEVKKIHSTKTLRIFNAVRPKAANHPRRDDVAKHPKRSNVLNGAVAATVQYIHPVLFYVMLTIHSFCTRIAHTQIQHIHIRIRIYG